MAERRKYCFFATPFRRELNGFLYLKRHLLKPVHCHDLQSP